MWALLLIGAIACATASYNSDVPGFNPGQKYEYQVLGRSVASVNEVGNQYVGTFVKATLEMALDSQSVNQLNVKVTKPKWAKFHNLMVGGWETPVSILEQEHKINWKNLQLNHPKFAVILGDGEIQKIVVDQDTPTDQVNLYRGMISPIILKNQNHLGLSSNMEESVLGKYKTQYAVSHLSRYLVNFEHEPPNPTISSRIIEVVKTTNFTKTARHNIFHFGLAPRNQGDIGESPAGHIVRSAVTKMILDGELGNYTINTTVSVAQLESSPLLHNTQKNKVNSKMNLTLVSVSRGQVDPPSNPQEESIQFQMFDKQQNNANHRNRRSSPPRSSNAGQATQSDESSSQADSSSSSSSENDSDSSSSSSSSSGSSSSEESGPLSLPKSFQLPLPNPFNSANNLKNLKYSITSLVKQIAEQITNDIDVVEQHTLSYFVLLVDLIRNASLVQLEEASNLLNPSANSNDLKPTYIWKVLRDAVAQSGTKPALVIINNWFKHGLIPKKEAVSIIESLPDSAIFPNPPYIKFILENFGNDKNRAVQVAALAAVGKLTYRACVDKDYRKAHYPVHNFHGGFEDCPTFTQELIYKMDNKLEEAVNKDFRTEEQQKERNQDVLLYTLVLGYIADDAKHTGLVADTFSKYLGSQVPDKHTPDRRMMIFERLAMVSALYKMAIVNPKASLRLAYNVYQNEAEADEVRGMAVDLIMLSNPSATILQEMARKTHTDKSRQVVSAVVSAIKNYAQSKDPELRDLASNAKAALHQLHPKAMSIHYTHFNFKDYFMQEFGNIGYKLKFSYIGSNDHLYPSSVYSEIVRYMGGMDLPEETYTFMLSSLTKLIDLLNGYDNDGINQPRDRKFNADDSVNMGPIANEPFEAQLLFPVPGGHRFVTITKKDIRDFATRLKEEFDDLNNNKTFDFLKLVIPHEISYYVPDVTGSLNYISFKRVSLTQVHFSRKGEVSPPFDIIKGYNFPDVAASIKQIQRLHISSNVNLTYANMKYGHIGLLNTLGESSPFVYDAGVEQQALVQLPAKVDFTYYVDKNEEGYVEYKNDIKIQPLIKSKEFNVTHMKTEPFTTHQELWETKRPLVESKNKKIIHVGKAQKWTRGWGPNNVWMLNVTTENEFPDFANYQRRNKDRDALSYVFFPFAYPDIQHNDFTIQANTKILNHLNFEASHSTQMPKMRDSKTKEPVILPFALPYQKNSYISKASFSMNGNFGTKKYNAITNYTNSYFRTTQHLHVRATVLSINGQLIHIDEKMNFNAAFIGPKLPPIFHLKEALDEDPHVDVEFELRYQNISNRNKEMDIKGKCKLRRSAERLQHLETEHRAVKMCKEMYNINPFQPVCLNATYQAFIVDEGDCNVKYDFVEKWFANVTYALYRKLYNALAPFEITDILHQGQKKNLQFGYKFLPNLHGVTINISAPQFSTAFRNVSLNHWQREVIPVHPANTPWQRHQYFLYRGDNRPRCQVDGNLINTFDNKTYPITPSLNTCWSVVMTRKLQSSPEYQNETVLIRQIESGKRIVRQVLGNGKVMIDISGLNDKLPLLPNSIVIRHIIRVIGKNGKDYTHQELVSDDKKYIVDIIKTQYHTVLLTQDNTFNKMFVNGLNNSVLFDGRSMILSLPQTYRGNTRGLCGTFNANPHDDFMDSDDLVYRNAPDFMKSSYWNFKDCNDSRAERDWKQVKNSLRFPANIIVFPPHPSNNKDSNRIRSSNGGRPSNNGGSSSGSDSSSSSSSDSSSNSDSNSSSDSNESNNGNNNNNNHGNGNPNKNSKSNNKNGKPNKNNNNNNNQDSSSSSSSSSSSNSNSNSNENSDSSSSSSSDSNSNDNNKNNNNNNNNNDSNDDSNSAPDYSQGNGRRNNPKGKALCSVKLTKLVIMDDGEKFCFSKEALRQCNKPCRPSKMSPKSVEVHCIKRGRTAEYFQQQLQSGQNVDFSQKSTSQRLQLQVPESCH